MDKSELASAWDLFYTKRDKKSKRKLVEHYFPYVQNIAKKLAQRLNFHVMPDELSSFGVDGLYKALEAFDRRKKNKFETYAYNRIKGSMIDAIRSNDWIPRSVRLRSVKLDIAKSKMENKIGHMVADDEIYRKWHVRKQSIKNVKKFRPVSVSSIEAFAEKMCDDNGNDHNVCLKSKNTSSPDGKIIRKEFLYKLFTGKFNKVDKRIVYLYYYGNLTMREIAKKLCMSESRVSQIHQAILLKMRKHVKKNMDYFNRDILRCISQCNDKDPL
jgi:RNA polymerase sigma factor for flagellar operon FliA